MARTLTLQLPDEIYHAVKRLADQSGREPEAVAIEGVTRHVTFQSSSPPAPVPTPDQLRRHFGAVSTNDPGSSDNPRIDADLAHQYGGNNGERP